jgi:hypothetical protein
MTRFSLDERDRRALLTSRRIARSWNWGSGAPTNRSRVGARISSKLTVCEPAVFLRSFAKAGVRSGGNRASRPRFGAEHSSVASARAMDRSVLRLQSDRSYRRWSDHRTSVKRSGGSLGYPTGDGRAQVGHKAVKRSVARTFGQNEPKYSGTPPSARELRAQPTIANSAR